MPTNDSNSNQPNNSKYKLNKQSKWRKFYLDAIYTSPMALYDFITVKNDLLRKNGKPTASRSKNVNLVLWVIARHLPTTTVEGKETNLKDISAATWMSLDYIANQAGISKSRVSESIGYLRDEGILIETIDERKGHDERYRAFSEYAINVIIENTDGQFARYGKRNWRLRKAELAVTDSVTNRVKDQARDINLNCQEESMPSIPGVEEHVETSDIGDVLKLSNEKIDEVVINTNQEQMPLRIRKELDAMSIDHSKMDWDKMSPHFLEQLLKACLIYNDKKINGSPLDFVPPKYRKKENKPTQMTYAALRGISGMIEDLRQLAHKDLWIDYQEFNKKKDLIEAFIRKHSFPVVREYFEWMITEGKKGRLKEKMTFMGLINEETFDAWAKYTKTTR